MRTSNSDDEIMGLVGARPVEEKKGADKGIDGKILLRETPTGPKAKQIIFSVKGGGVSVKDVRDLLRTVEELLNGKAVKRPQAVAIDETFKKAPKAKGKIEAHPELEL